MKYTDVKTYLNAEFGEHISTISTVSSSDNGNILVDSGKQVYSFDKIKDQLYTGQPQKPSSVDALYFIDDTLELVEFKSGFKKIITEANFDDQQAKCEYNDHGITCKYLLKWSKIINKSQDEVLKRNLKLKAIESYLILDKKIFSECDAHPEKVSLKIVIDCNGVDAIDELAKTQGNLAGNGNESIIDRLKNMLKPYIKKQTSDYFYSKIDIMYDQSFKKYIEKKNISL